MANMAHSRIPRRATFAVVVLAAGSLVVGQSAFAQADSRCKRAEGDWLDTLNAVGGTSGTITNAGILNGTTETVYDPAFVFTLDPNVVSYIAETTITTNHGLLVTNNVYLYNFITRVGTTLGTIDPDQSTGRFAGATGVLYVNTTDTIGVVPNQSYKSTITGAVCLASE
jgi:hypothetical protein